MAVVPVPHAYGRWPGDCARAKSVQIAAGTLVPSDNPGIGYVPPDW